MAPLVAGKVGDRKSSVAQSDSGRECDAIWNSFEASLAARHHRMSTAGEREVATVPSYSRETTMQDSTGTPPKMIEFWFDFGSNYSYLSVMRVVSQGIDVAWRPFLLGPIFQSFGWNNSPFVL